MATVKPLKEPLTDPIWDQQEGEGNKHYFFFMLFCIFGGFLSHFFEALQGHQKGTTFLGVTLKYVPFKSYDTLKHISKANKWFERREAKEKYENDFLLKQYEQIDRKRAIEKYELKEDTEYEGWVKLNDKVKFDDKLTGGQFKDYTQGLNNIQANKNTDKEKPTDYSKQKVEADVDATAEFKTPLDIRMEEFQKQIREGVPRKRLEDELKDDGIL